MEVFIKNYSSLSSLPPPPPYPFFTYLQKGYVNGNLKAQISVSFTTVLAQGNAEFAMEVYNIDTCTQYPPSNELDIGNVVLKVFPYLYILCELFILS